MLRFLLVYTWFAGCMAFFFPLSGVRAYFSLLVEIGSLWLICKAIRWAFKRSPNKRDTNDPIEEHRRTMDRMREVFTPDECEAIEQDLKQTLLQRLRER